jgi:putative transcriptional regulator
VRLVDHAATALMLERIDMKNRIRVLRAERNWTQADLAERLDVSRNSVNSIENGKYDPSLPLAFRIADVFGLRIEDIFLKGDKC